MPYETAAYAAQDPGRQNPSRLLNKDTVSGEVQVAVVQYQMEPGIGTGSIINLCILPAGVISLPGLSKIICRGAAFNTGLGAGTQANPNGWFNISYISDIGEYPAGAVDWTDPAPLEPDPGSDSATVFATVGGSDGISMDTVLTFVLAYKLGR
jgi:hypothetical protein